MRTCLLGPIIFEIGLIGSGLADCEEMVFFPFLDIETKQ